MDSGGVDYVHHPAMASSFQGAITVRTSGVNTGAIGSAATIGAPGGPTFRPLRIFAAALFNGDSARLTVKGYLNNREQRPRSVHAGCTITDVDHQVNTGPYAAAYGVWGC
jgi:hypothetical protein